MLLAAIIGFEIFAVLAIRKSRGPLPPLVGNFAEIREGLAEAPPKEEFSFALFGGTVGGTGRFDLLAHKLRQQPMDFAVHLGDGYAKSYPYWRAQLRGDLALPFPLFFVEPSDDLDALSRARFEEDFGPSHFSFVYQDCLFVALGSQPEPGGTLADVSFLEELLQGAGPRYRHIFVFLPVPTQLPAGPKKAESAQLEALFSRYKVDYVISGHDHGYARLQKGETAYLLSGAGEGGLAATPSGQFDHGLVLTVGRDFVSETVMPLPTTTPLQKRLHRFAFVELYPWLVQNRALALLGNLALLLLGLVTIRSLGDRSR
ncbi:MAG: hypothetical protein PF568_01195 [Deltaproteobacteria bacterium]|jgi:hypothetical protein|nr:hypothetical protein [Deltaproteobacteria bacterium]